MAEKIIDEDMVKQCCDVLVKFVDRDGADIDDCLNAMQKIQSKYNFANEKITSITELLHQKQIDDMDKWRHWLRVDIQGIRNLASIHNTIAEKAAI